MAALEPKPVESTQEAEYLELESYANDRRKFMYLLAVGALGVTAAIYCAATQLGVPAKTHTPSVAQVALAPAPLPATAPQANSMSVPAPTMKVPAVPQRTGRVFCKLPTEPQNPVAKVRRKLPTEPQDPVVKVRRKLPTEPQDPIVNENSSKENTAPALPSDF